jgi:hypothetical protein
MAGMTPVSRFRTHPTWDLLTLPPLARFSLHCFVVMLLGTPSCLLTNTTEFPVPVPSPPFADANTALATPQGGAGVPITKIVRINDETEQITFSTDVRAEDLGRLLYARVFVNYYVSPAPPFEDFGGGDTLQPRTFDDVRRINATLQRQQLEKLADGCYQATLVITHQFDNRDSVPVSQDDTALVVWWMIKGDPALISMSQCPGVPPSPDLDGGAEGGI